MSRQNYNFSSDFFLLWPILDKTTKHWYSDLPHTVMYFVYHWYLGIPTSGFL